MSNLLKYTDMKKLGLALVAIFMMTAQVSAMSYEQAREQALFLTDKMAYELNLTEDQYEAAYEVNLDYLMGVNSYDDVYGTYWTRRNLDLSYILLNWQYRAYLNATYFYRPLYWDAGYWHFGIYARYPHRHYYYFGRPSFYTVYRGGHSWMRNGGRSWYHGRSYGRHVSGTRYVGMRDGFTRGDYGRGQRIPSTTSAPRSFGNGNRFGQTGSQGTTRSFGNSTQRSSTRTTVTRPGTTRSFGSRTTPSTTPSSTFTPRSTGSTRSFGRPSTPSTRSFGNSSSGTRSFGSPSTRSSGSSAPARSFGGGHSTSKSTGGHFGRGR